MIRTWSDSWQPKGKRPVYIEIDGHTYKRGPMGDRVIALINGHFVIDSRPFYKMTDYPKIKK